MTEITLRRPRRRASEQDKKIADQSKQLRNYNAWKRNQFETMARGKYGQHWQALIKILRSMTLPETVYLPEYIERQAWLRDADREVREIALTAIDGAIIRLRIRDGRSPMDDAMPGEPPTVFEQIRVLLKL
jgi:hypothetical protein